MYVQVDTRSNSFMKAVESEAGAKMFINKALMNKADMLLLSVMLRESINQTMNASFQRQWKHFTVDNRGSNQHGSMVSVRAKDDVGKYLWYGTLPHYIEAAPGYALEFPDEQGNIIYREQVFVSGISPYKEKMTAAIDEAVLKVMLLWGK